MKMPVISPAVRVSFGLVMFTLSILLIADLMGVIPKKDQILLDSRKKVCESLAVQLSVATTSSDNFIVNTTLRSFVIRNDDVLAASMTKVTGEVVAEHGEFKSIKQTDWHDEKSNTNVVVIPVYNGSERWGSVNVEFADMSAGIFNKLTESIFGLLIFVALSSLAGYIFILR